MSTSIFGLTFVIHNVNTFRAFGLALSTQLSSMLTKVATSVDIDWNTVPLPTTGQYATNIELYTFSDSTQSTFPLFFRFEYGITGSSYSLLRLSIGKSCNLTTGVLSGILLPATIILENLDQSAVPQTCYISNGDGSSLSYALAPTYIDIGGALLIERAFNTNGTINGDGLYVAFRKKTGLNSATAWSSYFIAYTAETYKSVTTSGIFPLPLVLATGEGLANGNLTPYFPAACLAPNGLYWLPRVALGGSKVECSAGTIVNNLLDNHNYIGIGQLGSNYDQRNSPESSILMRWN